MTTISMVGIGPGDWAHLTGRALERLSENVPIFSRLAPRYHPVLRKLEYDQKLTSMFHIYAIETLPHAKKYQLFADIVIKAAQAHGRAIYAVPGNVFVFEQTPRIIVERCKRENIEVEVVPGLSSIDAIYAQLNVDPGVQGMQILDAHSFNETTELVPHTPAILLQVFSDVLERIKKTLLRFYPPRHVLTVVGSSGFSDGGEHHERVAIETLDSFLSEDELRARRRKYELLSLYIPPLKRKTTQPRKSRS